MPQLENQSITTSPNAIQKVIKSERVGGLSKPLSRQNLKSCLDIYQGSKASSRQLKSVDSQCVCTVVKKRKASHKSASARREEEKERLKGGLNRIEKIGIETKADRRFTDAARVPTEREEEK